MGEYVGGLFSRSVRVAKWVINLPLLTSPRSYAGY